VHIIEIYLSEPTPVARDPAPNGKGGPYFLNHGDITLTQGETDTLVVSAVPPDHFLVKWNLIIDYVVDGDGYSLTVDDKGNEFSVTGVVPRYRQYFETLADPSNLDARYKKAKTPC
jgi:hypothetical protein